MKPQEITDLLNEVSPFIVVPKGQIDKGNELVIRFIAVYKELKGKTLGEGSCVNCILDGFFELKALNEQQLIFLTMERTYKMKATRVVWFNHSHYVPSTITDEIALEMVAFNRNHSDSFENGDELLAALDAEPKTVVEIDGPDAEPTDARQPKKRGYHRKG
jgi:hypothetical protein